MLADCANPSVQVNKSSLVVHCDQEGGKTYTPRREGVLLLLMYVQMHVLTLRCGFCKSRKTTLVKLVKRFNAKQMQKCLFDCLLLASFSVVISLSYFVRSISLVGKACKFPNRFLHPARGVTLRRWGRDGLFFKPPKELALGVIAARDTWSSS